MAWLKTHRKAIALFFLLNTPLWVLYFVSPQSLRLVIIFLAFGAMWALLKGRNERKHLWTPKLRDIWWCMFLWCVAAAEGNIELWYRHAQPSVALLLVGGILILTIKGVFNGEKYTIDQP